MSGGIDTGHGDHIGDADEMVGGKLKLKFEVVRELACNYWEKQGLPLATDAAADQPDAKRSVRG